MITPEQEIWLAHLPDDNTIKIYPYDPAAPTLFEIAKQKIKNVLGADACIELHGAAALGISGQGELDIDVPVPAAEFDAAIKKMETGFGKPKSLYSLRRARFVIYIGQTKAEIIVVNLECGDWTNLLKFENYLKADPKAVMAYKNLKEAAAGLSTQQYYRAKTEFINKILAECE